ncbi:MAG TPA: hypothetical protein VJS38_04065 [Phenylobacterium sp.]|uniref:hypothetical protein n=1 Tax=Phenylobacterium sp. TaxID=1871053 RepID=UPI002B485A23|nr:hypothetical protein [Phenylobacterium sp.]HKR87326.1 hypothetical protein [Phenylobacterium sp.]
MDNSRRVLRAMLAELTRLENRVWARNPEEDAPTERRKEMLVYLMTDGEWRRWCAMSAVVAEMLNRI